MKSSWKRLVTLMKITNLHGFSGVYKYTVTQALKRRSFIVSLIFTCVVSLCIFPFLSLRNGYKASKADSAEIEKIYVINETPINICEFPNSADDTFSSLTMEYYEDDIETLESEIIENAGNELILHFYSDLEKGGYIMDFSYNPDSNIKKDTIDEVGLAIKDWITDYKIASLNLDDNVIEMVKNEMEYVVISEEDFLSEEESDVINDGDYWLIYAAILIIYFVVVFSSGQVSNSLVEEKTNKIVEYLMTSVRPMALILGKICATLTTVTLQLSLTFLCAYISSSASKIIFNVKGSELLSGIFSDSMVSSLSLPNIIACILIILLGIFIYSLIAGLFASTVNKMEELQQSMRVYTLILVISFLGGYFALNMMTVVGFNSFVKFTMLFPFSSVMVLPGAILIGKCSVLTTIIGIVILLITSFLCLWFVSLCYESVIVSNGAPLSFKQMIAIAKDNNRKKGGAKNE